VVNADTISLDSITGADAISPTVSVLGKRRKVDYSTINAKAETIVVLR
jgi:hypothetical protein